MPETQQEPSVSSPSEARTDTIKFLKERVTAHFEDAKKIIRKSGLPDDNKRLEINIAAGKVREELEGEKDPLTGTLNRKGLDRALYEQAIRSQRQKTPFVYLQLDANNLKKINDEEGHDAGDKYLKKIAKTLQLGTRQVVDKVARWGGDEFGILLENTDMEGLKNWWEKIAVILEKNGISIGAGACVITPQDLEEIRGEEEAIRTVLQEKIHLADQSLYFAKPLSKADNCRVLKTSADIPTGSEEMLQAV